MNKARIGWVVLVVCLLCLVAAQAVAGNTRVRTRRVSLTSRDTQGRARSELPAINGNGRVVAFASKAELVPKDDNGTVDVYVRYRRARRTELVSVSNMGQVGNASSSGPAISANGRYVVFNSEASNFAEPDVPPGAEESIEVFIRDLRRGITERVAVATNGDVAFGSSFAADVSDDGRFVVYTSAAGNLDPDDTNPAEDVFVRDRLQGTTELVSDSGAPEEGPLASFFPSISGDGRYIAFESDRMHLVDNDTNLYNDVFVADRMSGEIERVSVSSSERQGSSGSNDAYLSTDGRYVVFTSHSPNLVKNDHNGKEDVFLRNRVSGRTFLVGRGNGGKQGNDGSFGGTISDDGRYVAFSSDATDLVRGDTNGDVDNFLYDRVTRKTVRVNVSSTGKQAVGNVEPYLQCRISADGRFVAFESKAANLIKNDTNKRVDIFLRGPFR